MTCTVIIVTLDRPECVRKCLECLRGQVPAAAEVIVVDASADERTRRVVEEFAGVVYLRNEKGVGRMTASRNIGLMRAGGEIVAFLDDDAFAHEGWLAALLEAYDAPEVGAVGGRALNNQPEEATKGVERIGKLTGNGALGGNFAADPGKTIEVDHVMGCNMSFRRAVLEKLGGFREDYPGISGVREDTDMSLRVGKAGFRLRFAPRAVVTHVGAPQVRGRRFDTRYAFYAAQNHCILLVRNFGISRIFLFYILLQPVLSLRECFARLLARRFISACARLAADAAGTFMGLLKGTALLLARGTDPVRHDSQAAEIRKALSRPTTQASCE